MATDNDLAALLPDPPPPKPARREAAVAEAMRRFDGEEPSKPVASRPKRGPAWWRQPQLAALASIALVVTISLPIWWLQRDKFAEVVPQPPPVAQVSPSAASGASAQAPQQEEVPGAPAVPETTLAAPAGPAQIEAPIAGVNEALADSSAPVAAQERVAGAGYAAPRLPAASPPPPPPPPPPPAPARARQGLARESADEEDANSNIVVTGSRAAQPTFNSPSAVVSVDSEVLAGGNWNACTILDEDHSTRPCPSRRASGRAASRLADGLNLAWNGDLDRAIDAFSDAVRISPDFSQAYLNRGLSYQKKGDLRRALSDLNRAVTTDRNNASAYHHRSQVQRALGDTARAAADERRAEELSD